MSERERRVTADRRGGRAAVSMSAERDRVETFGRLENGLRQAGDWYHWGPYLSERQWGTVREDYSPDGTAWDYLPHDHARSRAYRWGEDGLAGFSDIEQRLCLGLALWNGRDPILKERIFGLTGSEGNHGEDAKEYWWYLDALPSHAWNRWRYHYPQGEFPYGDLVAENARRGKLDPEYELLDTGVFDDDRYWIVEADYAKGDPHDLLLTVRVTNAGPETDTLHVLPTAWYRNTWAWGLAAEPKPELRLDGAARVVTEHPFLGELELRRRGRARRCSSARTRRTTERLFGTAVDDARRRRTGSTTTSSRAPRRCAPTPGRRPRSGTGSRSSPGETATVRVRLRPTGRARQPLARLRRDRRRSACEEADEFYAELTPAERDRRRGARAPAGARRDALEQAALRLRRRAAGSTATRASRRPPDSRPDGRNTRWRTFDAFDIMSMPDKWEYPWFAAWDLAFHCVALARVDPAFAKYQLILLCREWFQHPNGALAGLRVVVRRRQPARAGLGGARGVRDRRRPGHRLPRAGSSTSCSSTSPGG